MVARHTAHLVDLAASDACFCRKPPKIGNNSNRAGQEAEAVRLRVAVLMRHVGKAGNKLVVLSVLLVGTHGCGCRLIRTYVICGCSVSDRCTLLFDARAQGTRPVVQCTAEKATTTKRRCNGRKSATWEAGVGDRQENMPTWPSHHAARNCRLPENHKSRASRALTAGRTREVYGTPGTAWPAVPCRGSASPVPNFPLDQAHRIGQL